MNDQLYFILHRPESDCCITILYSQNYELTGMTPNEHVIAFEGQIFIAVIINLNIVQMKAFVNFLVFNIPFLLYLIILYKR